MKLGLRSFSILGATTDEQSQEFASDAERSSSALVSVIEGGLTKVALRFNVTAKAVAKWVERFHAEGADARGEIMVGCASSVRQSTCLV